MSENSSESLILDKKEDNNKVEFNHYFGQTLEIKKIDNGDSIPVGGTSIFSNKLDKEVVADFDNFEIFFKESHQLSSMQNLDEIKDKLQSFNMDIDAELFAPIFAFNRKLVEYYFNNPEFKNPTNPVNRDEMYSQKNKDIKLSDFFDANVEECSEFAILAQGFLQREGISSSVFNGEVLWDKNDSYGEPHSFIVLRNKDKTFIYDPANPIRTPKGHLFPSVYSMEKDFDKEISKNQKIFITGTNIRDKSQVFFGAGNQTEVLSNQII